MPAARNDSWYQADWVKALAVVIVSVTGATGVQMQFPARSGAWTAQMHEEYAKRVESERTELHRLIKQLTEQQQEDRDMIKAYSDANRDDLKNELLLYLLENYYTKKEIPPDRVSGPLVRHERWIERAENKFYNIEDRLNKCCIRFEQSAFETASEKQ